MRSIRRIVSQKPSHSYQVFKRNAKSDSNKKIEDFPQKPEVFTLRSNSRLKSQKQKLHSWTRKCTKVTDSIRNLFLTCKRISNFNTRISEFLFVSSPGVTKGFIKGEALRLLRTNTSQFNFEENMSNFKTRLQNRDYLARDYLAEKHL